MVVVVVMWCSRTCRRSPPQFVSFWMSFQGLYQDPHTLCPNFERGGWHKRNAAHNSAPLIYQFLLYILRNFCLPVATRFLEPDPGKLMASLLPYHKTTSFWLLHGGAYCDAATEPHRDLQTTADRLQHLHHKQPGNSCNTPGREPTPLHTPGHAPCGNVP